MRLHLYKLALLLLLAASASTAHAQTTIATAARNKPPLVARVQQGAVASSSNSTASQNASSSTLTFKILQLADLHFSGNPAYPCRDAPANIPDDQIPCTEALMSAFVDELLDTEKPDFVVFTGDNVQTFAEEDRQRAVDAFTRGVEQRQIPFAVVLGNHDDENGFAREDVLRMAMNKSMSYTQRGPLAVDGVGNYMLSVHAPVGGGVWGNASDPVLRLYFLDSGGYPDKAKYPDVSSTYDWIKPSQVQYYRNLSLEAQASQTKRQQTASATKLRSLSSAGTRAPLPPALMFFHIPLQEYEYSAMDWKWKHGESNEKVTASDVHSELFSALVERDEVKATFCGHDHINEYCFHRDGIQLCYGGGTGFGVAYGSSAFIRRARVIEWSVGADNKRTIRSWKRLFGELDRKYSEEELYSECSETSVGLVTSDGGGGDTTSMTSSAAVTPSADGATAALASALLGVWLALL